MGVVNFFRVGSPALVVWPESGCNQRTQAVQSGFKSYTGSNTNIIWKTHQRGSWPNNRILYNSSWSPIPSGCWRTLGTQSISSKFITRRKLFLSAIVYLICVMAHGTMGRTVSTHDHFHFRVISMQCNTMIWRQDQDWDMIMTITSQSIIKIRIILGPFLFSDRGTCKIVRKVCHSRSPIRIHKFEKFGTR